MRILNQMYQVTQHILVFQAYRLTFIDGIGIYYSWNGKEEATTKYVFSKSGSLSKKYDDLNKVSS